MTIVNKPKIIVFSAGTPPIGSWHQRIRMFNIGFTSKGFDFMHIVPYYAPTLEALKNSPPYISYCLNPRLNKPKRDLFSIFKSIIGTIKGIIQLSRTSNIQFIIVPGLNLLLGIFVLIVSKIRKIPFYAEIADENGRKFSGEKLSLFGHLAQFNQTFYEKIILARADKIFVFTSYLEKKYRRMFPFHKKIIRTIPSLIDVNYFDSLSTNDIKGIKQDGIELLNSKKPKIVYAGACNRTNGLFFFLDAASRAKHDHNLDFLIFFFFVYGDANKVKDYCNSKGLSENVLVFSTILPEYIPAVYAKSDILVLPEHGDLIANAGFPGKTSELLASGKAIISTNFSDLHIFLKNEKNAMVSELGDDEKYTDNLVKLLTDKELRHKLGKEARTTATRLFNCKLGVNLYL